jgi:hypothetical protein
MMSTDERRKTVIEWLEGRIRDLREELNNLEYILSLIKGGGSKEAAPKGRELPTEVKVISAEGNVLANVIENNASTRIIFTEGFPKDSMPVKSFLLKLLEDKKRSGSLENYEVIEKRGYIVELRLTGITSDKLMKELELALKYVWRNLGDK